MKSIAGTELIWKRRKENCGAREEVMKLAPTAREEGDYWVVDAIVAGDNRDKGLSIVAIENGLELTCIEGWTTDERWNKAIERIKTGVWVTEEACAEIFGGVAGTDPHCPYK